MTSVTETGRRHAAPALGTFERYLTVWVALCIVAGIVLGRLLSACAVTRRRFSSGCKPRPATAPAGSDRSRHGGDEMSEAFG